MSNFTICKPASKNHRIAMVWFSEIVSANKIKDADVNRAVEFYTIFSETADSRYLQLTEDSLKNYLSRQASAPNY